MQALHFLNRHQHAGAGAAHHNLPYALSTALTERRTDVLRHLAQRHGSALIAQALICLDVRQRADLLSLLNPEQRLSIQAALPHQTSPGRTQSGRTQKHWNLTQRRAQPLLFQRFLALKHP